MFDLELENLKLKMRVKNLEIIIIEQASPPGTAKSQSICFLVFQHQHEHSPLYAVGMEWERRRLTFEWMNVDCYQTAK